MKTKFVTLLIIYHISKVGVDKSFAVLTPAMLNCFFIVVPAVLHCFDVNV